MATEPQNPAAFPPPHILLQKGQMPEPVRLLREAIEMQGKEVTLEDLGLGNITQVLEMSDAEVQVKIARLMIRVASSILEGSGFQVLVLVLVPDVGLEKEKSACLCVFRVPSTTDLFLVTPPKTVRVSNTRGLKHEVRVRARPHCAHVCKDDAEVHRCRLGAQDGHHDARDGAHPPGRQEEHPHHEARSLLHRREPL